MTRFLLAIFLIIAGLSVVSQTSFGSAERIILKRFKAGLPKEPTGRTLKASQTIKELPKNHWLNKNISKGIQLWKDLDKDIISTDQFTEALVEEKQRRKTLRLQRAEERAHAEKVAHKTKLKHKEEQADLNLKIETQQLKLEKQKQELVVHTEVMKEEQLGMIGDKRVRNKTILLAVVAVAVVAGLTLIHYGGEYLNDKFRTPTVVSESSVRTSLLTWLFPSLKKEKEESSSLSLDKLILNESTKTDIGEIALLAKEAKNNGLNYSNVLLFGPPGTGKTFAARIIAQQSGLDYAIIPGSAFTQLPMGKDIEALQKMFDWAESSKDGLILFIDEAESLLQKRDGKSRKAANLLNFFLSKVQKASNPKLMFIFATNYPNRLDSALDTRISRRILVPLPGQKERGDMLKMYLEEEVSGKNFKISEDVWSALPQIAAGLEGASGRAIQDMAVQVQQMMILTKMESLGKEDLTRVADRIIRQKTDAVQF